MNLESISIGEGNEIYYVENNCLIKKETKELVIGTKNSVIPNDVTSIGDYAFCGRALTSISIPDSVTVIGFSAFRDCVGLEQVTFGSGLEEIKNYAFEGCVKLVSAILPDATTDIGFNAFENCTDLAEVICNGMETIKSGVFKNCTSLESITCNNAKTVERDAFENCSSLESISLPAIETIGDEAFKGCSSLKTIKLGSGLKSMGLRVFSGTQLATVEYDGTKASWNANVSYDWNMTKVDGVTKYLHATVTCTDGEIVMHQQGIGLSHDENEHWNTCSVCDAKLYVSAHKYYGSYEKTDENHSRTCDGCGYKKTEAHTLEDNADWQYHWDECTVCGKHVNKAKHTWDNDCDPDCNVCGYKREAGHNVNALYPNWEYDNTHHWQMCQNECGTKLEYEEHTFYEYTGMCEKCGAKAQYSQVTYSSNSEGGYAITGIGTCADTELFLPTIYEGYYVTKIADGAFANNEKITKVNIPSSVSVIGANAFKGCTNLKEIVFNDDLTRVGAGAFDGTQWLADQPDGIVYAGVAAYGYKNRDNTVENVTIEFKNGTKLIADEAFMNLSNLTTIVMPENLTTIGEKAFYNCTGVETISMEAGVSYILEGAFKLNTQATIRFNGNVESWDRITKFRWYNDKNEIEKTTHITIVCTDATVSVGCVYDGTWSRDDTNHWNACKICGGKDGIEAHTLANSGCDHCTICQPGEHGQATCGTEGHYNCDGDPHSSATSYCGQEGHFSCDGKYHMSAACGQHYECMISDADFDKHYTPADCNHGHFACDGNDHTTMSDCGNHRVCDPDCPQQSLEQLPCGHYNCDGRDHTQADCGATGL